MGRRLGVGEGKGMVVGGRCGKHLMVVLTFSSLH